MYDDFKGKSKKVDPDNEDDLEERDVLKKDDDLDLGEGGIDDSLIDEIFDDEGDTGDEEDDESYNEDEEEDWDNGFVNEDDNY
jgi:hypothetical protein